MTTNGNGAWAKGIRGNPTCRLLATTFADIFMLTDDMVHTIDLEKEDFQIYQKVMPVLRAAISSLQAHVGEDAAVLLGVKIEDLSQAIENYNIFQLHASAGKIQETILREGLIAITEECSRREVKR